MGPSLASKTNRSWSSNFPDPSSSSSLGRASENSVIQLVVAPLAAEQSNVMQQISKKEDHDLASDVDVGLQ